MENLKSVGIEYISNRVVIKNDAVMFDIDDTLIYVNKKPIFPMIELLYRAKYLGYKIVIITARLGIEEIINWTANELASLNISYDYLGFTTPQTKSDMKRGLPYRFILSVGDMPTDLTDSEHYINTSSFSHN
jgi:hypothetical protein|tara:strand:+ start:3624 stop:4019 length:396 start_codon:yes stop_codon:yes gene_type:complete